jgi:hypothetical protein
MLPLERYQIDRLLEEKAGQLEGWVRQLIDPERYDCGSYDTDTGREMGINGGYSEWYTVAVLLMVNRKKGVVKLRYSVSDDSEEWIDPGDHDDGVVLTPEEFEEWHKESILQFQANNPDQLRLPFPPTQSCLRFLHPLDVPEPPVPMEITPPDYFDIVVRYGAREDAWTIKWRGTFDFDLLKKRTLHVPPPCKSSGDRVEEGVAIKYVRDLLEIMERERTRL